MAREIIDFHTHPLTRAEENICLYEAPANSEATLLADMDRAGISRFCGSVISRDVSGYPDFFAMLHAANERSLALAERLGDRYIPGIMVHPSYVRESCEELERMSRRGVRLIGELVPYMHGWKNPAAPYDDPALFEILDVAAQYGMTVSVHSATGANARTHEAMATANPRLNFVLAHPGEKPDYLNHLELMKRCPNVYLDLSGTGLFRYGMLTEGVRAVGAERFLFGSDYPICNPAMNIAAIEYEPITDADRDRIFAENARRLLNL